MTVQHPERRFAEVDIILDDIVGRDLQTRVNRGGLVSSKSHTALGIALSVVRSRLLPSPHTYFLSC